MPFDAFLYLSIAQAAGANELTRVLAMVAASWLIWVLALWYVVAFVWLKRGGPREFLALVLGGGMVYLFNVLVTFWWWRPRPFLLLAVEPLIRVSAVTKSFPSDHAAVAFFLASLLVSHRRKWWWAYLVAATVALGRVAVGVHYPLDVLGGALVGTAFGYLTNEVAKLFQGSPHRAHGSGGARVA